MRARNRKPRVLTLIICVLLTSLSTTPHAVARAAEDDLPDDDGAPPSEYEPAIEARRPTDRTTGRSPNLESDVLVADLPSSPPVDNAFPISGRTGEPCANNFGEPRSGGRTHLGVDCFAPLGTPLVAVEDGVIRYATAGDPFSCASGGDISGNRVSVRGRSGYIYYYGHLDTIAVATDQLVQKGQVLGTVGATGNATCSTAHLHFEVKCGESGEPFDPYPVMGTWGGTTLPTPRWPITADSVRAWCSRAPLGRTFSLSSVVRRFYREHGRREGSHRRGGEWRESLPRTPMPPHPELVMSPRCTSAAPTAPSGSCTGTDRSGSAPASVGSVPRLRRPRTPALAASTCSVEARTWPYGTAGGPSGPVGLTGTGSEGSPPPTPTPRHLVRAIRARCSFVARTTPSGSCTGTDRSGSAPASVGPVPRVRRPPTPALAASTCSVEARTWPYGTAGGPSGPVGLTGRGFRASACRTLKRHRSRHAVTRKSSSVASIGGSTSSIGMGWNGLARSGVSRNRRDANALYEQIS